MTAVLDQGIDAIVWLQRFSPTLDGPFLGLTFLGNKEFFLLLLPCCYWCLDRRVGARLTIYFMLSAYINAAAKIWSHQPRPFAYSDRVRRLVAAGGGGFPSGHTQSTVLVWGYLAACFRRAWLWGLAVLLMLLVPLSRVYLGVHFPTDLVGGYWLGGLLLLAAMGPALRLEAWILHQGPLRQLAMAVGLPLALMAVLPGQTSVSAMATAMGFMVGLVAEARWVGFDCDGTWRRRSARFLLAEAVLAGLWLGLGLIFDALEPRGFFLFLRSLAVGLWTALGAPWVFVRLGLAGNRLKGRCP